MRAKILKSAAPLFTTTRRLIEAPSVRIVREGKQKTTTVHLNLKSASEIYSPVLQCF